jgi:hypothetical protein
MTNPTHKFSKETFLEKFNLANGHLYNNIEVIEYKGVNERYKVTCSHKSDFLYGWQIIKPKKHCCPKGYHENRIPAMSKSLSKRLKEIKERWGNLYDLTNARFDPYEKRKIIVECKVHGEFSQWTRSLVGNSVVNEACPTCSKENNRERSRIAAHINFKPYWGNQASVSKAETKWLDSLNVIGRQVFLEDIYYTVDGYDYDTNTVYLYHGRFWHGCPNTYDPEEQHPILKVKMKELYEKTIYYENKIKDAGYGLIVHWGT